MTRIDATHGDYFRRPEGRRHDAGASFGYPENGTARSKRDGLHRDLSTGQFELGDGDRNALFRDKIQRELKKDRDGGGATKDDADLVLLAVAREGLPLAATPGAALAALPGIGNALGARWVEQLCNRIEQSVLAEMRTSGRHAFSLHLDLQNSDTGLTGLHISMTESSIDVVLVGAAAAAGAAFGPAVQALADRLQSRFSRRVVRIHEAKGVESAHGARGMEEISELLAREGTEP